MSDLRIEHLEAQVALLREQLGLVVSLPELTTMKADFDREMQTLVDEQETEIAWQNADFSTAATCDCGSC